MAQLVPNGRAPVSNEIERMAASLSNMFKALGEGENNQLRLWERSPRGFWTIDGGGKG